MPGWHRYRSYPSWSSHSSAATTTRIESNSPETDLTHDIDISRWTDRYLARSSESELLRGAVAASLSISLSQSVSLSAWALSLKSYQCLRSWRRGSRRRLQQQRREEANDREPHEQTQHTQPTNQPTNQPSIRISRSGAPDRVNLRTAARAWYLPGTRPPTAHVPTIP